MTWYHWRDNWHFARYSDGEVAVKKCRDDGTTIDAIIIPASEWASIIAHASAKGETAENYAIAERFHNGDNLK